MDKRSSETTKKAIQIGVKRVRAHYSRSYYGCIQHKTLGVKASIPYRNPNDLHASKHCFIVVINGLATFSIGIQNNQRIFACDAIMQKK